MLDPVILIQVLWTSVASASFQVLFTIAFALVLKVTGIWNFTQPALMGVAFYAMYVAVNWFALPLLLAVLAALAASAVLSAGIERIAFRALRRRAEEPITYFIFTLIFAQFVVFVLTLLFTPEPLYLLADMVPQIWLVGGVVVTSWDLIAIVLSAGMTAALWHWLRATRQGQFMIAVADNADLAEIYGIDKERSFLAAMLLAALFTTAGTYLFATKLALFPELPLHVMLFAVAATILGGIGSVFGAAAAAVAISVLQQFSVLVIASRWQPLVVFAILFIAIILFPNGVRWRGRQRIADGRHSEDGGAAAASSVTTQD
ncbi:MAG: branched-chain amino acid ABC transporter permease [Alphaproteobacteria bacterium]|nr:branched-chain amino acid ABC transporter permease [Alphaproteobacteria bacterium]